MASVRGVQAVPFDSGGVLVRPVGGRWNPRAGFEPTVLSWSPGITSDRFEAAIAAGDEFMANASSTPDYDDYHRVILRRLAWSRSPGCWPNSDNWPDLPELHAALGDDVALVAAAIALGYQGRAICRDGAPPDLPVPFIDSLTGLLSLC